MLRWCQANYQRAPMLLHSSSKFERVEWDPAFQVYIFAPKFRLFWEDA